MGLRDSTFSLGNITKNRTAKQCLGFAIPQSCSFVYLFVVSFRLYSVVFFVGQVLQEVRDEDIPEHLKRKFQEEK